MTDQAPVMIDREAEQARSLVMIDVTDVDYDPMTPGQWCAYLEHLYHDMVRVESFGLGSHTYSHPTDDERRVVYVAWINNDQLENLRSAIKRVRERRDANPVGLAVIPNIELV